MAEAKITTAEGIVVEVHGTPEEVSTVVERLSSGSGKVSSGRRRTKRSGKDQGGVGKVGIPDLVEVLRNDGFFKTPKGLGEIRTKFADMGHHYPLTTLSGAMQLQARNDMCDGSSRMANMCMSLPPDENQFGA